MNITLVKKLGMLTKWKKISLILVFICVIALVIFGLIGYDRVFQKNVKRSGLIHIRTGAHIDQVLDTLVRGGYLTNPESFKWLALQKKYSLRILPGAYFINMGWNNNQLINHLRSGVQVPVKVTLNNIRFREELAVRLANYLESDSSAFSESFNNESFIQSMGFTCESFPAMVIPNTYEFYWNTTPQEFIERMKVEYLRFWNDSRMGKAHSLGLSPLEIITIASIVQEESNKRDEKPRIAGVYINRFKKGWLLQADPTVKYAMGSFQIRRILTKHLTFDSPYNTYRYAGLPPGPINFPDITSIEAVLNAERHTYFYFCAKEDFSGYHNFANSLSEHNRNAAKYQNALNRNKIWR